MSKKKRSKAIGGTYNLRRLYGHPYSVTFPIRPRSFISSTVGPHGSGFIFIVNKDVKIEVGDIVAKVGGSISPIVLEEDTEVLQVIEIVSHSLFFGKCFGNRVVARLATPLDKEEKLEEQKILSKRW